MKTKQAGFLLVDRYAHDIGRQQVRCELDTLEMRRKRGRQRLREGGLAGTRVILNQDMATTDQHPED